MHLFAHKFRLFSFYSKNINSYNSGLQVVIFNNGMMYIYSYTFLKRDMQVSRLVFIS